MRTNRYNKVVVGVFSYLLLLTSYLFLTSCEGGDLFSIDSPDWISAKADSIAQEKAKNQGGDDVIEGLQEDVYTVGILNFTFPDGEYASDTYRHEIKLKDVEDNHVF